MPDPTPSATHFPWISLCIFIKMELLINITAKIIFQTWEFCHSSDTRLWRSECGLNSWHVWNCNTCFCSPCPAATGKINVRLPRLVGGAPHTAIPRTVTAAVKQEGAGRLSRRWTGMGVGRVLSLILGDLTQERRADPTVTARCPRTASSHRTHLQLIAARQRHRSACGRVQKGKFLVALLPAYLKD